MALLLGGVVYVCMQDIDIHYKQCPCGRDDLNVHAYLDYLR
jgi:hypothetical protein